MDFGFSSEDAMIKKAIHEWVNKECAKDTVRDMDDTAQYPKKLLRNLSRLGFNGLTAAETYGGEGENLTAACLIVTEIASRYPVLARCYAANALLGGMLLSNLGDEEQKKKFLPGLCSGKQLACIGLRFDGADKGEEGIRAQWDSEPDTLVVNGAIDHVENADQADIIFLPVEMKDAPDSEPGAVVYMILDAKMVQCRPGAERMGYKGLKACTVECRDLKVSADRLLGGKAAGKPGDRLSTVWDLYLLSTAFEALGIAKGAYDATLEHARQRVQFNRSIGKFPAISRMINEMLKGIQAAELLSFKAAWKAGKKQSIRQESAIAAWSALEAAQQAVQDSMQIFGGYGYTMEYDIQRYFRDITVLMNAATAFESLNQRIALSTGLAG
ncbi:MAG: acyl-CoA dehydrogenase family protein [Desulfobacterales bacterium]|nr:acyl-CoA dehydrogenase family protein [Desulfobacterales bacterium]